MCFKKISLTVYFTNGMILFDYLQRICENNINFPVTRTRKNNFSTSPYFLLDSEKWMLRLWIILSFRRQRQTGLVFFLRGNVQFSQRHCSFLVGLSFSQSVCPSVSQTYTGLFYVIQPNVTRILLHFHRSIFKSAVYRLLVTT